MYEVLDWNKLPEGLRYLSDPAEKYGRYQFDDKIIAFFRNITSKEKAELEALTKRYAKDGMQINEWLDQYRMTHHPEARLVYFLGYLLAMGCDDGYLAKE